YCAFIFAAQRPLAHVGSIGMRWYRLWCRELAASIPPSSALTPAQLFRERLKMVKRCFRNRVTAVDAIRTWHKFAICILCTRAMGPFEIHLRTRNGIPDRFAAECGELPAAVGRGSSIDVWRGGPTRLHDRGNHSVCSNRWQITHVFTAPSGARKPVD